MLPLLLLISASLARCNDDELHDLPGLAADVGFKHYSGYLKASNTRFLHYWFVESLSDPANDPLVIWFNGGPGCSSLLGLLGEHGPYLLDRDAETLKENTYSWNRFASVVYVDAPAGVGFSYVTEGDDGVYNDYRTAAENYEALKEFFARYPRFRSNNLFIVGESYGAVYVAKFAARILDGQDDFPVNLTGIALGNGMLDYELYGGTRLAFLYAHGFVGRSQWSELKQCSKDACNDTDISSCNFDAASVECNHLIDEIYERLTLLWERDVLNTYDLYRDCQSFKWNYSSASGEGTLPPCTPDLSAYLNKAEVRQALHVSDSSATWAECSETIRPPLYEQTVNVRKEVSKVLASEVRVLLYYGDTDSQCNFLMGQKFPAAASTNEPWLFRGKLAGFKTTYAEGLTFITVRGVGHTVPQFAPARAHHFMRKFLETETI